MIPANGKSARLSLLQRLLALAAVATLPATLALLYLIASVHSDRKDVIRSEALRMAEIASLEMDRIIGGAKSVLLTMASAPELEDSDAPGCDLFMARVTGAIPHLRGFALIGADGSTRCASGDAPSNGPGVPDTPPGELVTGLYTVPRSDGPALLPLSLGLGERGVLRTWLDLDWLQERVLERDMTAQGALTVADREGVILAREPMPENFVGTRIPDAFQDLVQADRPGSLDVTSQDGTDRVIGYWPPAATGIGLYVAAGLSTKAAFAPIWRSTMVSLGLAAAGLAGTFLMTWAVGDRIIRRPIRRLLETVGAWRAGDFDARTGVTRSDGEIMQLAEAIDGYMDEVSADRSARARAESHRELLLAEMQHRIKNTLSTVQAVARQTLSGSADPESIQAFAERLRAMAEAHSILLSENWESADLRTMLENTVRPFDGDQERRLHFEGADVRIQARGVLALAMAVHELCTNAAKYGALSVPGGAVIISWRVDGLGADGRMFRLTWQERGGPKVVPTDARGFGSRMIETVLAAELGAEATLSFAADGLVFTLEGDASRVLA